MREIEKENVRNTYVPMKRMFKFGLFYYLRVNEKLPKQKWAKSILKISAQLNKLKSSNIRGYRFGSY